MNNLIKCISAEEVYKAIEEQNIPEIYGFFRIDLRANCRVRVIEGCPIIRILGSSSPTIWIFGSSTPTIWTYGSSSPTIWALDSSSPAIRTQGSSTPTILAYGSSNLVISTYEVSYATLRACDSSTAILYGTIKVLSSEKTSTIRILGQDPEEISGEAKVLRLTSENPIDWVNLFELPVIDNEFVYLYKALGQDFCAMHNKFKYTPGTTVEAPDWDSTTECHKGLHFSPTPKMAQYFRRDTKKFVACKVKISEIITHPNGFYPEKVKAPRVYEIVEVDIKGNRV